MHLAGSPLAGDAVAARISMGHVDAIAADMVTVFGFLAGGKHAYPNELGYEQQFVVILDAWRPECGNSEDRRGKRRR